ncbi:eukaryotic translation initiation factor 5B-like [Zingiber officinale]|uniref:Uncharacterized protein n=1 Tax=Zingiber officinale TaxID=94328 RepID=A0A8J5GRZ6_ZINOF|nr:eukaryotic translation initiation factor 5B-like [Zingiber officinale]KAG6505022.1 hypothetical protein ZIOFF_037370 [Zingiber officinale]
MRVPPSRLLPSPGRSREPAAAVPALSSSRSRRLRSSGSVKGGQSPMFPLVAGGRRKGVAFEAAEPSSPKVTCIGQVRVKSKKKKASPAVAAVVRSRSVRGSGTEASFRRMEDGNGSRGCWPSRKHKWANRLPVSINCFFPCGGRSLCSSSCSRSGANRAEECGEEWWSSNGAVFARWPVAVPQSEEGKERGVFSVVVEEKRDREMGMVIAERVKGEELGFDVEVKKRNEVVMLVGKGEEKQEEVQICIPPRNALLLMRCRSDPVRMAALTTRLLDSPAMKVRVEERDEDEGNSDERNGDQCAKSNVAMEGEEKGTRAPEAKQENQDSVLTEQLMKEFDDSLEKLKKEELNSDKEKQSQFKEQGEVATAAEVVELEEGGKENAEGDEQEQEIALVESEKASLREKIDANEMPNESPLQERETGKEPSIIMRSSSCPSTVDKQERTMSRRSQERGRRHNPSSKERGRRHSFSTEREARRPSFNTEKEVRRSSFSSEGKETWSFSIEKDGLKLEKEPMNQEQNEEEEEEDSATDMGRKDDIFEVPKTHSRGIEEEEEDGGRQHFRIEEETGQKGVEEKSPDLPDCLLLMLYEPKLSMEVSKETWVCSDDFLQRNRHPSKSTAAATTTMVTSTDEASEIANENKEVGTPMQDDCRPPAPTLLAADTEKKLTINAVAKHAQVPTLAYEPLVLTRCKSEPMRLSASLTPDACFWRDRHRPIGATGIGF